MGKKRIKTAAVEPQDNGRPGYDFVTLPPDTYEKETSWSREVILTRCRYPGCTTMTENVLCDQHFYGFVRKYRPRLVDKLSTSFPKLLSKLGTVRLASKPATGAAANGE